MQKALGIIYSEHRSLSAVLSGLKSLAQMASDPQVRPDFAVFHAMIYYTMLTSNAGVPVGFDMRTYPHRRARASASRAAI